jgi:REP element-mobilizing transposase RayT
MPRLPRLDQPGTWHHVMNRGIARRTMFETEQDSRYFLSLLARAVRRGDVEIHAFCVLTTHFHLLVRSPTGRLSRAMQRVQLAYSRRFNRTRRRDGTLVRSRFRSKLVRSLEYRKLLVSYIDRNPVEAGLVESPWQYPHGSACRYLRDRGPPWLQRQWIEALVCERTREEGYRPELYSLAFGSGPTPAQRRLLTRRIHSPAIDDPLDDLLGAAAPRILDWMRRKSRLADGTEPGLPVADCESVDDRIAAMASSEAWSVRERGRSRNAWPLAHAGLLRELCAASLREIAVRLRVSEQRASVLCREHLDRIRLDADYGVRVAELARRALGDFHASG